MKLRLFAAPFATLLTIASLGMLVHGEVPDVPTGQWLAGPALAQPRAGAVSVALDDGRVLVIGGRTADGPVNTVEVFGTDGVLSLGAPMLAPRVGHAVAKLPDGRVLVSGGTTLVTTETDNGPVTSQAATASAEIFDPLATAWFPVASLSIARSGATATAVLDGHVVVAGGAAQNGAALDSFEVFDPESGVFSSPGLLSAARMEHAAAVAGKTKVLVTGGRNADAVLATGDIVDVTDGSVTTVVLNAARAGATATTLLDGKILVAGGSDGVSALTSTEVLDPVSGASALSGSMAQARRDHQALLLANNNTVLITGGTATDAVVSGAEQFVPWTGAFSATASPAAARASAAASNVGKDGVAWLAAGRTTEGAPVAESELYGFATLKTDKDDYPPGSTVLMTGSGWQPGEQVTVVLHEVGTGHSDRSYFAIADAAGRITNAQFATDDSHVGVRFYLTARGAASQAQSTFTDALNTNFALTSSINPSGVGQPVTFTAAVTYAQAGGGHNSGDAVTVGLVTFGENGNGSCGGNFVQLQAPQTPNINGQVTFTTSSLTSGGHTIRACYNGTGGNTGTNSNSGSLTQTVNACTAPSVSTQPTAQSAVYGANATFSAAANGNPAPTVQWQVSTNAGGSWTDLAGQTATTLTLTKPTVSSSGNQYRAVFTNTCTPSTATSNAATLTVSPKNLTISGAVAQNKIYDATVAATVSFSSAVLGGVESGDAVTINSTGYTATFANKTVGNSKPVTVTGVTLSGAAAGNYIVPQPSGLTANITSKGLTIAGAVATSRQYDGTPIATVSFAGASLVGVVGGDTVGINAAGYAASFADKTVGAAKPVVVTGVALNGIDSANYTVSQPSGLTATITPKNLTIIGAVASNKPYDGTVAATVNFGGASLVGVVSGDVVTINSAGYAASFADKAVGTNKPVTVTGVVLSGGDAGNYTVSQPSGLTANITAKPLTITGAVANSRQYDGTVTATVNFSGASLVGAVSGDSVSIGNAGYAASFADKTVGTGKPVTVTDVVLSGSDAGNYLVAQPSGLAADITAKSLAGTFTAASKVYDGATSATVATSSLPGVTAPDVVTLNVTNAAFDTKAVGTGKTVTANLTLAGVDAGNYTVNATATALADVTPLGISGSFTAADKVYDATTAATIGSRTLSGLLGTDTVSLTGGSASFPSKNVGTHTVTGTGFTLAGGDAGNYTLGAVTASAQASITPLGISGSFTAADKVYDATAAATIGSRTLSGVLGTDTVSLTGGSASFASKNVGTHTVTGTGFSLAGTDAGNYTLGTVTASAQASITPLGITGSFTAADKVYDGTTTATVLTSSLSGTISGDAVTLVGGNASFDTKNVGTGKTVTLTGAGVTGTDAANYSLTSVSTTTADVTAKGVTGSFTAQTREYDGTTGATVLTRSLSGAIGGDAVSLTGGTASFDNQNVGTGKTVTLTGSSLTGTDAGNYNLTSVAAAIADITPRPVTVTADAKSKTYGDTDPALTHQITSGTLVTGDALTGALTRAAGETVGLHAIGQGTLVLSANYALTFVGADLTITARAVTVAADAKSKTYGDADPTLTYQITSGSLAFSDAFTGVLTRAAGETVGLHAIGQGTLALTTNYALTFVGADLTITARAVTVAADAKSKTYGDADPALTYQITSGSLAFSDGFTGSLARAAGETVGLHAIGQGTLALSANYALTFVGADLTITARAVTVAADAKSKTYGDADPALTYQITSGSLGFSDAFTGVLTRAAGETVGLHAIGQGTLALSANYALSFVGADLTITARAVTVAADAKSKIYGDADPALTYQITSGSLGFSDAFTGVLTRAAGETVGLHAIGQGTLALSANYALSFVGADLTITARAVTVAADAKSKTYGDADPALTYQITSGSLGFSDAFTGVLTRAAGETVGAHAIQQSTLALGSNYALTFVGADLTITARAVTVAADAKSKTYGDADPALSYQITSGSLAFSDGFTGSLARAAGETVGLHPIGQGTLALSANYGLSFVGADLTITQKSVTGSFTASDKVYEGLTTATIATLSLGGVVGGDDVSLSGGAASFGDKHVGTGKTVTGTGFSLAGTAVANYTLASSTLTTTASITKRGLAVNATGMPKTYDGTTAATVTLSDDRVGSDTLTTNYTSASFTNKGVGNGKSISVSGITISGSDAGNYALANTTAPATANITARTLDVTAAAASKVYDGTTNASVTLSDNRVAGDVLTLAFVSASFGDKNAANGKTVTVSGISVTGADAGNYAANTSATTAANITPALLTITAADKAITFGAATPTFTVTYAGFVAGEASSALSGALTFTFQGVSPTNYSPSTTAPTAVGSYKNTPGGVSNANYAITFAFGSYTIGAWSTRGFYQPVGETQTYNTQTPSAFVWNTIKGGSTVPLKFNIFKGTSEASSTGDIASFTAGLVACVSTLDDSVDPTLLTTGGTTLRYSGTPGVDGQFIQNWATPKVNGQACYRVAMTAKDGSLLVAFFKLNK